MPALGLMARVSVAAEPGVISVTDESSNKQAFLYASCYCEENILMLCKALVELQSAQPDGSDLFVVFISNSNKQVPIWCQINSRQADGFCLWDYHVICIQKCLSTSGKARVWDLDTSLGLPVSFEKYLEDALKPCIVKHSIYQRLYRVIAAPMFLKYFASDRRHMKTSEGQWLAVPPNYECIVAEDGAVHNLENYVEMSQDSQPVSREELLEFLAQKKSGWVLTEDTFQKLFSHQR